ncbi:hypothetical protein GCM10009804_21460 [Kribbella hippodromi]|uniref:SRPBCC family protein n=1 Tax=Kribbella hippodromi TaxID=434347 RepID=A0ABN2CW97_9ACTN
MGEHEAWTTIDVAPNLVFDRLSDLDRLPEYLPWMRAVRRTSARPAEAQGPEARRPRQAVHEEVAVTTADARSQEGWIDVVDEARVLRWGAAGPHDYAGELAVDFVADGTSRLTVRVRTNHDDAVDAELAEVLTGLKTTLERENEAPKDDPEA